MNRLEQNISLIVGEKNEKEFFQQFFEKIYMHKNNDMVFSFYQKHHIPIIFLDFDKKNTLKTIKKIREIDKKVIISLLITDISKSELLELLPLHISGYLKRPLVKKSFEELFYNYILVDLNILEKNRVKIKPNYLFDTEQHILYDNKSSQIKLTKHESQIITLLSLSKNHFLTTEILEHSIWEEDSYIYDCNNRLKYLINSIRKKLPKDSLINKYGLGYQLLCESY